MSSVPKWLKIMRQCDFSYVYAFLGETTMAAMFLLYVLLARMLGPEDYGVFTAAVALAGIFGVLIQFGLPALLTRNVATNPQEGTRTAGCYLMIQILNTLPVLAALPFLAHILGFTREGTILCVVLIFAELFRSIKMLWRSVMKGNSWFRMESVSVAIERFATVLCALAVLALTRNLLWVVTALMLVRLVDNLGVGGFLAGKVRLGKKPCAHELRDAYRKALPFAVHGILWILYYQVDMVMLKAMAPEKEVGYYGAAYRVVEIFSALPRVVFYVAFTRFARCMADNPAFLPRKVLETCRILLFVMLPPLVIVGYTQPWLMRWMFGQAYLPSILLLAVILPSLGMKMFSTLSEEFLLASGSEKKLPPLLLAVALSNIGVNLLLIPSMGAMGAAIATTLSECIYCALGMTLMIRNGLGKTSGLRVVRVLFPAVFLGAVPAAVVAGLPLAWSAVIGILGLVWLYLAIRPRTFFRGIV